MKGDSSSPGDAGMSVEVSIRKMSTRSDVAREPGERGVSIVIPAYNEQESIGSVVAHLHKVMDENGMAHEVIVVDDGSEDGTASRVERLAGVTLLRHRQNRGYGAAIKTGIRGAGFDVVCITDADGTYPNQRIPGLVADLIDSEHDMVVGSRGGASAGIPLIRRPAKWFIGRLAELMTGRPIPDLNSGLRVFRRETALRFFRLLPDGFSLTSTITLAMINNGYSVKYVPIDYHARVGRSKIRPVRDTLNFVILVLRISLCFAPLKVFLPLSGFFLFLAIAWGLFSKFIFGKLADTSTLLLAMGALQVAVVGLLADLVDRRLPNSFRERD